jgi:muramoyltetrapeptide carboxypeptidase
MIKTMKPLKPHALKKGDVIGIVSPASAPSTSEKIEKGVAYLEKLGYRVKLGKHILSQKGYLAGEDKDRADDFNSMIHDKSVKAIFCSRGGYGTPRILSLIDYKAMRKNPKIIVGYSDITALQLAIWKTIKLVTFSGPMLAVEMWNNIDSFTEEHFWRMITSTKKVGVLANPIDDSLIVFGNRNANGTLLGGNFALVMSIFGTQYFPDIKNAILFLEDTDEAPHRVDRMLVQLESAGVYKKIAGLVFGRFTDCVPSDPKEPHLNIDEIIDDYAKRSKLPVLINFLYGHVAKKLTMPIGLRARLDINKQNIQVLESAVE